MKAVFSMDYLESVVEKKTNSIERLKKAIPDMERQLEILKSELHKERKHLGWARKEIERKKQSGT